MSTDPDRLIPALQQHPHRYAVERELWAWWQAEDAWMRAPRRPGAKHRPGRGQLALVLTPDAGTHAYGPHPRRADGRLDWREARRIVEDERDGRAQRPRPPADDDVSSAEQVLMSVLGAVRIA